jgi:hypothetical protein
MVSVVRCILLLNKIQYHTNRFVTVHHLRKHHGSGFLDVGTSENS